MGAGGASAEGNIAEKNYIICFFCPDICDGGRLSVWDDMGMCSGWFDSGQPYPGASDLYNREWMDGGLLLFAIFG
jgi:hypothetical protein